MAVNTAFAQLKKDLEQGTAAPVYIFYGEESYLREHYLRMLRQKLVPAGMEEFNYHRLAGKGLTMQELSDIVEAMPMMSERTLVEVTDLDLFKMAEEQRNQFVEMLSDFPDYCCLVFLYDLLEYKPDGKMKKLKAAIEKHVQCVKFEAQERSNLINWVRRRFKSLGKDIENQTAEHLLFLCGNLMTGLVPEISKIAAYAKGPKVTVADINAVADPILDAVVFDMTNEISRGNYDKAAERMSQLLKQQTEPIMILAALGKELRRLYSARIAIDSGKDKAWLVQLWNMRSDYPAKLLLESARKLDRRWCREALAMCQTLDRQMKSQTGFDSEGELKMLLMRLAQGAKR